MKYIDPAEQVLLPLIISVRADTAHLLTEMAEEMGISVDEVLSAIAEDSVSGLEKKQALLEGVIIPDKCSTQDLLNSME